MHPTAGILALHGVRCMRYLDPPHGDKDTGWRLQNSNGTVLALVNFGFEWRVVLHPAPHRYVERPWDELNVVYLDRLDKRMLDVFIGKED